MLSGVRTYRSEQQGSPFFFVLHGPTQQRMKSVIVTVAVAVSLLSTVAGKIDVFCYETGGDYPKRSDYPAYTDENKYRLRSQPEWDQVSVDDINSESFVYDWEGKTKYIRYDGNDCDANGHPNQSPIVLQSDNHCDDEHRMRGRALAECEWADIYFSVDQQSLHAEFIGCKSQPVIDFSHLPSYFTLAYMQVKVPSEHCRYIDGQVECYDGEIVFAHYGEKSDEADLRRQMLNIAGLIKATDQPNREYEEVLRKWELFQERQYKQCKENNSTGWADEDVNWGGDLCDNKSKIEHSVSSRRQRSLWQTRGNNNLRGDEAVFAEDIEILEMVPPVSWYDEGDVDDEDDRSKGFWEDPEVEDGNRRLPGNELRMYSKLLPHEDFYYRYFGSMTTPPCFTDVNWRVMREPFEISHDQLHRTEYLIAAHVNQECNLATVGRPRNDGTCKVDVNRELQRLQQEHELQDCYEWHGARWGNP